MIKHWSVYRLADGLLTGQQLGSSVENHAHLNTPAGCGLVEGRHDHLSRRVDLVTGQVIDWQPPADHPTLVHRARAQTLAQIAALEAQQGRPVRELALNPADSAARKRLLDIEAQIVKLRAVLLGQGQ